MKVEAQATLPVWLIIGPTAAGKTELATKLYQLIQQKVAGYNDFGSKAVAATNNSAATSGGGNLIAADLISIDSAMVYKYLDIGSNKPSCEQFRGNYKLLDIREPWQQYTVAEFYQDVIAAIKQSHSAGRLPILVGGSMMYVAAFLHGLQDLPVANPSIRASLAAELAEFGCEPLYARLQALAPEWAQKLKPRDQQRICRALELLAAGHEAKSPQPNNYYQQTNWQQYNWSLTGLVLNPSDRSALHTLIQQRFDQMLAAGLLTELQQLSLICQELEQRPNANWPALRSVGYKQAWLYLQQQLTKLELYEQAVAATRQLAKRQFTWLRRWLPQPWVGQVFTELGSAQQLQLSAAMLHQLDRDLSKVLANTGDPLT